LDALKTRKYTLEQITTIACSSFFAMGPDGAFEMLDSLETRGHTLAQITTIACDSLFALGHKGALEMLDSLKTRKYTLEQITTIACGSFFALGHKGALEMLDSLETRKYTLEQITTIACGSFFAMGPDGALEMLDSLETRKYTLEQITTIACDSLFALGHKGAFEMLDAFKTRGFTLAQITTMSCDSFYKAGLDASMGLVEGLMGHGFSFGKCATVSNGCLSASEGDQVAGMMLLLSRERFSQAHIVTIFARGGVWAHGISAFETFLAFVRTLALCSCRVTGACCGTTGGCSVTKDAQVENTNNMFKQLTKWIPRHDSNKDKTEALIKDVFDTFQDIPASMSLLCGTAFIPRAHNAWTVIKQLWIQFKKHGQPAGTLVSMLRVNHVEAMEAVMMYQEALAEIETDKPFIMKVAFLKGKNRLSAKGVCVAWKKENPEKAVLKDQVAFVRRDRKTKKGKTLVLTLSDWTHTHTLRQKGNQTTGKTLVLTLSQ